MSLKIAITGGPSGGKTNVIQTMQKNLGQTVIAVPEAASILYRGGFPRRHTSPLQKHVQRAIYCTQQELEFILQAENPGKLIICDRGSVDGVAYWPDTPESFYASFNTSKEKEFARYDWVLHLDTAPPESYDIENPIRIETYAEALAVNARILQAWADHPRRIIVKNQRDFLSKVNLCHQIIDAILANKTIAEIRQLG